jgi:hypothetical protein
LTLSWNTPYPNDERGGAATLQEQRNQYEKNGGTSLLKQRHRLRSLSLLKDFLANRFTRLPASHVTGCKRRASLFSEPII